MTLDEILDSLRFSEALPVETLNYCVAHPDVATPKFLEDLRRVAEGGAVTEADYTVLLAGLHVLGQLREPAAYRPLAALLHRDDAVLERLLGDAMTETVPNILIAVFDGDPAPLEGLIEDTAATEFARVAALTAWTAWVFDGGLPRDQAEAQLARWFDTLQPREDTYLWVSWVEAAAGLGLHGLTDQAAEALQNRVPFRTIAEADFKLLLQKSQDDPEFVRDDLRLHPLEDAAGALSHWALSKGPKPAVASDGIARSRRSWEPSVNPLRDVGRNDPCPCGSGKKFKKCCLGKD